VEFERVGDAQADRPAGGRRRAHARARAIRRRMLRD